MMPSEYVVLVAECHLFLRFVKLLPDKNILRSDRGRSGWKPELDFVLQRAQTTLLLAFLPFLPLPLHLDGAEVLEE